MVSKFFYPASQTSLIKYCRQWLIPIIAGSALGAAYLPFDAALGLYLLGIGFILLIPATKILSNYRLFLGGLSLFHSLTENSWLIQLVLAEGSLLYFLVLLLVIFCMAGMGWLSSIIFFKISCQKIISKAQPALIISWQFSRVSTIYLAKILWPDWFLGNYLLENSWLLNLSAPLVRIIGGANSEFLMITALAVVLFLLHQRHYLRLLIFVAIISAIIGLASTRLLDKDQLTPPLRLSVAVLPGPVDGHDLDNNKAWPFYLDYLTPKIYGQDLLIMPESAYNGLIEYDTAIDLLVNEKLLVGQSLLLGADRRELASAGFKIFNSAYLLQAKRFTYQIQKKEFLTPGAEYIPNWLNFGGLQLIDGKNPVYSSGKTKIIDYRGIKLGIALCLEGLVTRWYEKMTEADFYIILAREYRLPRLAKLKTARLSALEMAQAGKPWVKAVAAGQNIIAEYNAEHNLVIKKSAPGEILTGTISMTKQTAYYYRFWRYSPLLWLLWLVVIWLLCRTRKKVG